MLRVICDHVFEILNIVIISIMQYCSIAMNVFNRKPRTVCNTTFTICDSEMCRPERI